MGAIYLLHNERGAPFNSTTRRLSSSRNILRLPRSAQVYDYLFFFKPLRARKGEVLLQRGGKVQSLYFIKARSGFQG